MSEPYQPMADAAYRSMLSRGKTPLIVDCGANIGASAAWFLSCYPEARVIAVEPDDTNLELLRYNTRGLNVHVIAGGIAAQDGFASMANPEESGMGCYLAGDAGGGIKLYSLTSLLREHCKEADEPFVLKVDIEGGEENLCAGNEAAMERFGLIYLEPQDWRFPGQGKTRGFMRFHLESGRDLAVNHENLISVSPAIIAPSQTSS